MGSTFEDLDFSYGGVTVFDLEKEIKKQREVDMLKREEIINEETDELIDVGTIQ